MMAWIQATVVLVLALGVEATVLHYSWVYGSAAAWHFTLAFILGCNAVAACGAIAAVRHD